MMLTENFFNHGDLKANKLECIDTELIDLEHRIDRKLVDMNIVGISGTVINGIE